MAHYNRSNLLEKTLDSIEKSKVKDYEVIVVDDASDVPLVCERAKVIRIEPQQKWYHNPCIPFNIGFREAQGDTVIIQNPECYHVGDILAYVEKNIKINSYLSFGCYAISKEETIAFHNGVMPNINEWEFVSGRVNGWYNHTIYRPKAYHFCSAIKRNYLRAIGGFDERYAYGVAFDDDAFIRTIKRWELNVKIINNPFVIHQYHTHFAYDDPKVWRPLHAINAKLYVTT
jgi:glycosyltransferase involved in cell wall biosynthesis